MRIRNATGSSRIRADLGSFEIFSHAAAAVGPLRDGATDPLGGLEVQRVVAIGGSQLAMRLVSYANAVHPLHQIVDGFVLSVLREGRAPRLDEGAISEGGVRTTIRDDLEVPVLVVNSEFEAQTTAAVDLDDTGLRRTWEVTGTGTAPGGARSFDQAQTGRPPIRSAGRRSMKRRCDGCTKWLAHGIPAPTQPRIQMEPKARGSVARDELGNGLGGMTPGDRSSHRSLPRHGLRDRGTPALRRSSALHARRAAAPRLKSRFLP